MRKTFSLLLLAFLSLAQAAFVYGDVYAQDLEKINRTLIRAEGRFTYQLVTEKANYSIFLPEGDYNISATTFDPNGHPSLIAQEKVQVGSVDQKIDLVLKPAWNMGYLPYIALLILVAGALLWLKRSRNATQAALAPPQSPENPPEPEKYEPDDDAKSVLMALDTMEGRATQKEVREALHFSDSKLSLILTDLEQMGKIKKFKRGRANIIRKISS